MKIADSKILERFCKIKKFRSLGGFYNFKNGVQWQWGQLYTDVGIIKAIDFNLKIGKFIKGSITCLKAPKQIKRMKLIDIEGWCIKSLNPIFDVLVDSSGHIVLDFVCKKIIANVGIINDSDNVKLLRTVECYKKFFAAEVDSDNEFSHSDLKDLKFIGHSIPNLEYSLGYFCIEKTYESLKTDFEPILDNITCLLSYFLSDFVSLRISFYEGLNGKKLVVGTLNTMEGQGDAVFNYHFPGELSNFLNRVYWNYVNLKDDLMLNTILRYYIWMKNSQNVDKRFILASILLESLKYSFITRYSKENYSIDSYNRIYKMSHSRGRLKVVKKPTGFEGIMRDIYSEFRVHNGDIGFIDYRNEVIHQGELNLSYNELK